MMMEKQIEDFSFSGEIEANMIANPFYIAKAGIFVSCKSDSDDKKDNITERICSAIALKMIKDDNKLQDDLWIRTVGKIPYQIDSSQIDNSIQFSRKILAIDVAKQCISSLFLNNSDYDLIDGIKVWLSNTTYIDDLNCLSVSFTRNKDIQISLAFTKGIISNLLHIIRYETIVAYSDQHVMQQMDNLFQNFHALSEKPYYISV